jgi:hypothetical protein
MVFLLLVDVVVVVVVAPAFLGRMTVGEGNMGRKDGKTGGLRSRIKETRDCTGASGPGASVLRFFGVRGFDGLRPRDTLFPTTGTVGNGGDGMLASLYGRE